MSRDVFMRIASSIKKQPIFSKGSTKKQADAHCQFLVELKRLGFSGNETSFGIVTGNVGISYGSAVSYTTRCICALGELRASAIEWPSLHERRESSSRIEQHFGFPECLGFADGTLFSVAFKPIVHGEDYYTRKVATQSMPSLFATTKGE